MLVRGACAVAYIDPHQYCRPSMVHHRLDLLRKGGLLHANPTKAGTREEPVISACELTKPLSCASRVSSPSRMICGSSDRSATAQLAGQSVHRAARQRGTLCEPRARTDAGSQSRLFNQPLRK